MTTSPRTPSNTPRPRTQPLAHRLSAADSLVIVGALAFAGFLCIRNVAPNVAVVTTVAAVTALTLVVVVPRGVVEAVGLLRELVALRGESSTQRSENA